MIWKKNDKFNKLWINKATFYYIIILQNYIIFLLLSLILILVVRIQQCSYSRKCLYLIRKKITEMVLFCLYISVVADTFLSKNRVDTLWGIVPMKQQFSIQRNSTVSLRRFVPLFFFFQMTSLTRFFSLSEGCLAFSVTGISERVEGNLSVSVLRYSVTIFGNSFRYISV